MRLVADTNIVVSALLWHGPPHQLFERMREAPLTFYTSPVLLEELANVLSRRKLAKAIQLSTPRPSLCCATIVALRGACARLPFRVW